MSYSNEVLKLDKGDCFVVKLEINLSIEDGSYVVSSYELNQAIYDFVRSFLIDYCKVD